MLAVDSRSVRKVKVTYCIYCIFWKEQMFAPGVANLAQAKNVLFAD
jgi:hypothetical protein